MATSPIRIQLNLPYRDEATLDAHARERCRVDLYSPVAPGPVPALVWLHGGGLTGGTRADEADRAVAKRLAEAGIAFVSAGYRLSPHVRFPAYPEDAAAAFAWVRRNAAAHGIDARRVFLGGASAGAYAAMLAGFDARYLRACGDDVANIRGLVPVSGQTVTHFTVRAERGVPDAGVRPTIDDAAPCYHAGAGAPPTLLICGDNDMPMRALENRYLAGLLAAAGHKDVTYAEFARRDHGTIILRMRDAGDPAAEALIRFIRERR